MSRQGKACPFITAGLSAFVAPIASVWHVSPAAAGYPFDAIARRSCIPLREPIAQLPIMWRFANINSEQAID